MVPVLDGWRLVVVTLASAASTVWMGTAVVRLLYRRAQESGVTRVASDVESGLVGGVVPDGARVFDAWSYRVGARFAGRVRIAVYSGRVAVAGPRVPRVVYAAWLWAQALLLALVAPALLAAALATSLGWLLFALSLLVVSFAVSMGGAGLWPGLGELFVDPTGHFTALEFLASAVREVDIGRGWSKGGLEVVLFPYKAGVDRMAEGHAVSFFAPDESGREVRFALHLSAVEQAQELARLLEGRPAQ
jgi:hypothetical protein